MSNENKKQQELEQFNVHSLVSPPSHPTSLGNVWVGTTKPSPTALVEVLEMNTIFSDQARNH